MDELVGGGFVEFKFGRVPFKLRFWEARGYAAHQNGFGEEPRVIEIGGSAAKPAAGLNKFAVVIAIGHSRVFEILELFVGVKERAIDVRQNQSALGTNENRARVRPFITFKKRENVCRKFRIAVVPGHIESFASGPFGTRKDKVDVRIDCPIPTIRSRPLRAN